MDEPIYFDEEFKRQWRYAYEQARADRERYFNWLKDEIKIAIDMINRYDKIYVLGGLGARLLQASPNIYNQFLLAYNGPDKQQLEDEFIDDDEIEVSLEYAMSIASASPNTNAGKLPTIENINEIREQLSKIKFNVGFYEMSADYPAGGNEFDHLIKLKVMEDALHVRGVGYHSHVTEIYEETFAPHDGFLIQYYGFTSQDIYKTIQRLDVLVASTIGNPYGGSLSYDRFIEWSDEKGQEATMREMMEAGKHFIRQFTEANPDLYDAANPDQITGVSYNYVPGYNRLFWVIPKTEIEKKIFSLISHQFGDNSAFLQGKFGGFPLGDTIIQAKPLIKVEDKYYCFSVNLPFRNIFNITANLLKAADAVYYEQKFTGNASANSRDNYIEVKVKKLFEKLLPTVQFYHSLKYNITENGMAKEPELDILGVGADTIYIVEVKAGELNKKHRRGAILGLKDRLKETINEGSYQCYRTEEFINSSPNPEFRYAEGNQRKTLLIDKSKNYEIIKISVTYEHFAAISVNLKYLIESGVMSPDYKWTWIVSIFDLMVFADLIENEKDFKEFIKYRLNLYDRNDVEFHDEIDILGFFFENKFPLPPEKENEKIVMLSYKDEIEAYYTKKDIGMPGAVKPTRKRNS